MLYLIYNYLKEANLHETADMLSVEAQLTKEYELCDNIDLEIIIQDYQNYYFARFNKIPSILKKLDLNNEIYEMPQRRKRSTRVK